MSKDCSVNVAFSVLELVYRCKKPVCVGTPYDT